MTIGRSNLTHIGARERRLAFALSHPTIDPADLADAFAHHERSDRGRRHSEHPGHSENVSLTPHVLVQAQDVIRDTERKVHAEQIRRSVALVLRELRDAGALATSGVSTPHLISQARAHAEELLYLADVRVATREFAAHLAAEIAGHLPWPLDCAERHSPSCDGECGVSTETPTY